MQLNMQERRYVCFDGDVDALWIENMNSVMDDNKLLTLANGERIRLNSYCALLFEVKCLSMAPHSEGNKGNSVFYSESSLWMPFIFFWVCDIAEIDHCTVYCVWLPICM